MSNLYYSRMIVIWMSVGLLLLDSWFLYLMFSLPFRPIYIVLGWLLLGGNCMVVFGLSRLWYIEMEF